MQYSLTSSAVYATNHRISVDYFHGKPDQGREFADIYNMIKNNHHRISKVRLSYSGMEDVVLCTGIDPQKVSRIAIGAE